MTTEYREETVQVDDEDLANWVFEPMTQEATGLCPACRHPTSATIQFEHIALDLAPPESRPHLISCDCKSEEGHYVAGVDQKRCGRNWFARLTPGVTPAFTSVGDAPQEILDAASAAAERPPIDEVRRAAEKWTTGVTALTGLFGISGLAFGKDAISELGTGGKTVVMLVLSLATALGVAAIWNSWKAAYGWPSVQSLKTDQQLKAWYEQRRNSEPSVKKLRAGIGSAILALAALVAAVGLTVFWPKAAAPAPLVTISMSDGSTACGKLLPSLGSDIIRIRRTDGGITAIKPPTATNVALPEKC